MFKKTVCVLLVISFCFVMCSCVADKVEVVSNTEKKDISWLDYDASGVAPVTDVYYAKFNGVIYSPAAKEDEGTNSIIADAICPYCGEEGVTGIEFEEFPTEKLGNDTVVIKKKALCQNWSNHMVTEDSEYSITIILTLNNKD